MALFAALGPSDVLLLCLHVATMQYNRTNITRERTDLGATRNRLGQQLSRKCGFKTDPALGRPRTAN